MEDTGEEHLEEIGLCVLLYSLLFSASLALEATVAALNLSKLLVLPNVSACSSHSELMLVILLSKQQAAFYRVQSDAKYR